MRAMAMDNFLFCPPMKDLYIHEKDHLTHGNIRGRGEKVRGKNRKVKIALSEDFARIGIHFFLLLQQQVQESLQMEHGMSDTDIYTTYFMW